MANLDRTLERRPPAGRARDVLAAFAYPLTTREVATVMAPPLAAADEVAAELELIAATAAGEVTRTAVGDGALWALAG